MKPHIVLWASAGVLVIVSGVLLLEVGGTALGLALVLWAVALGLGVVGFWRRAADRRGRSPQ